MILMTVNDEEDSKPMKIEILKKTGIFSFTNKLKIRFTDSDKGIDKIIIFDKPFRTTKATLSDGTLVGKLPLKGITVLSNSEGIISLDGYNYAVSLSFSLFSFSDVTITDLASGRGCVASVSGEGEVVHGPTGNDQYEGLGSLFGDEKF